MTVTNRTDRNERRTALKCVVNGNDRVRVVANTLRSGGFRKYGEPPRDMTHKEWAELSNLLDSAIREYKHALNIIDTMKRTAR